MSQAGSSDDERLQSAPGQRACDTCKKRKIRCDRKRPCTHCRAASISRRFCTDIVACMCLLTSTTACRTTVAKPEPKSRVMVSKQYEDKIDRMDGRLASIEQLLRSLASQALSTPATQKTGTPSTNDHTNYGEGHGNFSVGTGPNVDLAAAKDVFERAVGRNPNLQHNVIEAMQALRSIVGRLDVDAETYQSALQPMGDISPPSWEKVAAILQKASEPAAGVVNWSFPCITVLDFSQRARRLYERQHRDIPTRRLLIYAGLFGLCCEFSALDSGDDTSQGHAKYYYDLSQIFQHLVLATAAELPLVLPKSKESVDALVAGSIVAVDMCKPRLSWQLASAAINLCQTLGYHRLSSMADDHEELRSSKIMLFWMAYMQDRGLALRLGHAPAIQDCYISLPRPLASTTHVPEPLLPMLEFWISVSTVGGNICERLYSPSAVSQSSSQRGQIAQKLANEMQQLWQIREKNNGPMLQFLKDYSSSIAGLMIIGDNVLYLGTMALILHAIPTNPGSQSPALEYARQYLEAIRDIAHTHCKNAYTWTAYCHWVLLNSPLTPFTVVFCQVISNHQNSYEDLELMRSYIASLHPACRLSSGVQKFYDLCSVFLRVAEAYTTAKIAEEVSQSGLVTGEFDEYLSSLGFAPIPQMGGIDQTTPDMSAYLQDWYSGNASLYGMLDMGIPGIEMSNT